MHFDHAVKSQPRVIVWTNLVDLETRMLYTKIQAQSFLGSGEKDFEVFLPYMGMASILLKGSIVLKNRHFLSKKGLINWYIVLIWS